MRTAKLQCSVSAIFHTYFHISVPQKRKAVYGAYMTLELDDKMLTQDTSNELAEINAKIARKHARIVQKNNGGRNGKFF